MNNILSSLFRSIVNDKMNPANLLVLINQDFRVKLAKQIIEDISHPKFLSSQFIEKSKVYSADKNFSAQLLIWQNNEVNKSKVINNYSEQLAVILSGEIRIIEYEMIDGEPKRLSKKKETLYVPGSYFSSNHNFYSIAEMSERVVAIAMTDHRTQEIPAVAPIFDAITGMFSHFVSSSLQASRIELSLWLMAEMNYSLGSDIAYQLAFEHPAHFVRWEAARTYARLNPEHAGTFLPKISESDNHPQVIRAAEKSLKLIKEKLAYESIGQ